MSHYTTALLLFTVLTPSSAERADTPGAVLPAWGQTGRGSRSPETLFLQLPGLAAPRHPPWSSPSCPSARLPRRFQFSHISVQTSLLRRPTHVAVWSSEIARTLRQPDVDPGALAPCAAPQIPVHRRAQLLKHRKGARHPELWGWRGGRPAGRHRGPPSVGQAVASPHPGKAGQAPPRRGGKLGIHWGRAGHQAEASAPAAPQAPAGHSPGSRPAALTPRAYSVRGACRAGERALLGAELRSQRASQTCTGQSFPSESQEPETFPGSPPAALPSSHWPSPCPMSPTQALATGAVGSVSSTQGLPLQQRLLKHAAPRRNEFKFYGIQRSYALWCIWPKSLFLGLCSFHDKGLWLRFFLSLCQFSQYFPLHVVLNK